MYPVATDTLTTLLAVADTRITYHPLSDEVFLDNSPFQSSASQKIITLPSHKQSDPYLWARESSKQCTNEKVCVFIPGTLFDIAGTRHGRGGGWYDRFLSRIPTSWIRIGVTHRKKLSPIPIRREAWDEPVDWVVTCDGSSWEIFQTFSRAK